MTQLMIDFLPPTAAPKEIPKVNTFPINTETLPSPLRVPFRPRDVQKEQRKCKASLYVCEMTQIPYHKPC